MKLNAISIVCASILSLIIGYFIGQTNSKETPVDTTGGKNITPSARSSSPTRQQSAESSRSTTSGQYQPKTAQGRAGLALRSAKERLKSSSMMQMDFGAIADSWNMLKDLNGEEIRLAMLSMGSSGGMDQTNMMLEMMLLNRWGEIDGQAAVEFALSQDKKGMMQMVGVMGGISSWIKEDPVAAEAWYEENKDQLKGGMMGQQMFDNLFFASLAKKDLPAALAKLDLNKTSDRNQAVQTLSQLATDVSMRDQVVAEVMAFEDQKFKDKSIESMIQTLSYQDPDGAEALIAEIGETDPKKLTKYKQNLLYGMRMYDAEAALDYSMTEFSEEKDRNNAVTSSFGSLASQDSEAAQKWLKENGDDYDKDKLIGTAMNRISWQSPDKAMDWALQTYDDDKRSQRVIKTYKKWKEQHETGAKEWLSQQDEDTQAAILEGQEEKKTEE